MALPNDVGVIPCADTLMDVISKELSCASYWG